MEGGVVSLVIIKLPYRLCGELVVSVELVTASEALVHQNVHFLPRTKRGSVLFVYVNLLDTCFKRKFSSSVDVLAL